MKNKFLLISLLFLFLCCKTTPQQETSLLYLKESFISKNDKQFLYQFPENFTQFHNYFGWDSVRDEPTELYEECNEYIDYWFELLDNKKHLKYERKIIGICTNGEWEADAVNYFQDKSLKYIKENDKYHLINDLKESDARSVLFFLFDSPHPEYDETFISNLSTKNQKIINELFETTLSSDHGE